MRTDSNTGLLSKRSYLDDRFDDVYTDDIPFESFIRNNETIIHVARCEDLDAITRFSAGAACVATLASVCVLLPFTPCIYLWEIEKAKKSAIILTNRTLYFYQGDAEGCLCCSTGVTIKNIPLERIQNIDIREPGVGCGQSVFNITKMIVETAGQAGPQARPELEIKGLRDTTYTKRIIMEQADNLKDGLCVPGSTQVENQQPKRVEMSSANNIRVRVSYNSDTKLVLLNPQVDTLQTVVKQIIDKFSIDADAQVKLYLSLVDDVEVYLINDLAEVQNNDKIVVEL